VIVSRYPCRLTYGAWHPLVPANTKYQWVWDTTR